MKVPEAQASIFSQLSFTQALDVPLWRVGRQSSENRVLVNEYLAVRDEAQIDATK